MQYTANAPGTTVWNLIAAPNPPALGAGPTIEHPAVDAAQYLYFAMNGVGTVDAGGQYQGIFTSSLCGCIAGFLIRTNGGAIRRITGYHQTSDRAVPGTAMAQFNVAGPNGPNPGDVSYLIWPDKANIAGPVPAVIAGIGIVHHYLRSAGDNVSWVVSFNGDMGEMTAAFHASRSREQSKAWGVQVAQAPPPVPADETCCLSCVIM